MDITAAILWLITWWIKGVFVSLVVTNVIPGILSRFPTPLKGFFMKILNVTLVIKLWGFTINIGIGTVLGYFLFSSGDLTFLENILP